MQLQLVTDRTVQTQPSWLHGFSGCILIMLFCDVISGIKEMIVLLLCGLHTPSNVLLLSLIGSLYVLY